VEDFVKNAVCAPWSAGADKFAISCAQREEHGVVEFFIIWYKVEFVSIDDVKFWSPDGFGIVWVGFNYTAVC